MILSIMTLVLILVVAPFLIGLIPCSFMARERRTPGQVFIMGTVINLTLMQLIAVPMVIYDGFGFNKIVIIYSVLLVLFSIGGLVLAILRIRKDKHYFVQEILRKNRTLEEKIEWVMFILIVVFQIVMYIRMASFDGDDAYYVVQSVLSYETGTLYRIRPYTGLSTDMDLRHSLAVFPVWMAYLAQVSGINPTIVAHTIVGTVLIPLVYMVYVETGRSILRKERKKLPVFMIFVGIMQVFGNVSIYTNATFFLTRTWQGKALLANFVIPLAFLLLLTIFDSEKFEKDNKIVFWIMLGVNNIVAAMCSTASVLLMAMLIGISGLVMSVRERSMQILLRLIVTCIPLVIYGCMYLLI